MCHTFGSLSILVKPLVKGKLSRIIDHFELFQKRHYHLERACGAANKH
jgi:hypothetical protein